MYTSNISTLPFTIFEATVLVVICINVMNQKGFFSTTFPTLYNINNIPCFMNFSIITNITGSQYTLRNLQEATVYSITVSGILEYGETNDYLTASTLAAGQHSVIYKQQNFMMFISVIHF